jgi:hypothetical protein
MLVLLRGRYNKKTMTVSGRDFPDSYHAETAIATDETRFLTKGPVLCPQKGRLPHGEDQQLVDEA